MVVSLVRLAVLFLAMVCLFPSQGLAQDFSGTYTAKTEDGQSTLELQQNGNQISGTYTEGPARAKVVAIVQDGKAQGTLVLEGVRMYFALTPQGANLACVVASQGEDGQLIQDSVERLLFVRTGGGAPAAGAAAPVPGPRPDSDMTAVGNNARGERQVLDATALKDLAGKVKSNFQRDDHAKVLAAGNPPLTVEAVASFAELLRLTFEVEMTEAEFDATSRHFVQYYQQGDAQTKTMLATGWQIILGQMQKAAGEERAKGIQEVRAVLAQRFAAGAQAGMPWAVAMHATLQRRQNNVASIQGPMPEFAKKAAFNQQMSEADLEASLEMLYFMWVASGRDPSLVTPEAVTQVRQLIVQGFPQFDPQVQYIFANGQRVYSSLRGQWAQATAELRAQMARQFSVSLDQLGLTVPQAGGGWSNMNGKSHSAWAAEMVQGLAGSSYKSSW